MTTNPRQRLLVARAATLALAACGMFAGYQFGRVLAIQMAENWLDEYSQLMAVQQDAASVEAQKVLAVLKKSQYAFCSDAEMTYFRELIYRSEYLKDAGRIHGGKIDCSATAGRPQRSFGEFKANAPRPDGTIAYRDLAPVADAGLKRAGLQLGSAYVVIASHIPPSLGPIPISLNVTMHDAARNPSSAHPATAPGNDAPDETTSAGTVRVGDTLLTTQCSANAFNCVTASTPISDALQGERGWVFAGVGAGGAAGTLLGIVFSLMYRRSRNREQQLRRAIDRDKLEVVYQPIVNLANGNIVGAEALARWVDEEGNEIAPDTFIRIAEDHGFVGALTKAVIRRALRAFADTLRSRPNFRINVNVAASDLSDPAFLPMLDESLQRASVQPRSLNIEITESSTANQAVAMETIRALRRRGHSIHVDDFGTGYSNLSYLLFLSVDTIKVDKAFTRVIGTESVTVAILPQILAMAESLNLDVIVEGVETEQQENYFSATNRPLYGQGWLYGRPVTAEQLQGLLAKNWARTTQSAPPPPMDFGPIRPARPELVPIARQRSVA